MRKFEVGDTFYYRPYGVRATVESRGPVMVTFRLDVMGANGVCYVRRWVRRKARAMGTSEYVFFGCYAGYIFVPDVAADWVDGLPQALAPYWECASVSKVVAA